MRIRTTVVWVIAFFATIIAQTLSTTPAHADVQSCVMGALQQAKDAGSDQRKLKTLYNVYFGEELARSAAPKTWKKLSASGRSEQVAHARKIVVSIARQLAEFANVKITFGSQLGPVVHGIALRDSGNVRMTFYMSGECSFSNIAIVGYPSLVSMVGDYTKRVSRKG